MRGETARHNRRLKRFRAWARRSGERLCTASHTALADACTACGAIR